MATRTLRVYLAYAEGDERCRDLLVSEALREKLAVDFLYMPAKQPWVPRWKAACRDRVFQCDGAIIPITKRIHQAEGVRTELEYIGESGVPAIGIYMDRYQGPVPAHYQHWPVVEWNWPQIASFIRSLGSSSGAGGKAAGQG